MTKSSKSYFNINKPKQPKNTTNMDTRQGIPGMMKTIMF